MKITEVHVHYIQCKFQMLCETLKEIGKWDRRLLSLFETERFIIEKYSHMQTFLDIK